MCNAFTMNMNIIFIKNYFIIHDVVKTNSNEEKQNVAKMI